MYIDREKQLELFDKYNTPERVRRHCNEVARVAGMERRWCTMC